MKNKGYTREFLKQLETKVGFDGTFAIKDVAQDIKFYQKHKSAFGGMINRLISHGIISRVVSGTYRLLVDNATTEYAKRKGKRYKGDPGYGDPKQMELPTDDSKGSNMELVGGKWRSSFKNGPTNGAAGLNRQGEIGFKSKVQAFEPPTIKIVPYTGNTSLIIIGKRTFLGTEVALTPLSKQ